MLGHDLEMACTIFEENRLRIDGEIDEKFSEAEEKPHKMSRLYDTVEPAVVDEEMLQHAVEEQGPKEEAGKIAKEEGIDFADVIALRLDFKNILKIDNLWCFVNLVKLQLDNNIIEKIEGLDMLTNLVWLDLSFNNIEVIEGLSKLSKLEDLTLYNNRIQTVENMDSLLQLHVFSIGNNDIHDLENLKYLRKFKHLQTLNLSGNPICEQDEYKVFTIAYLPSIEFLDYRLVDQNARSVACEKYEISIQEIQHDERQAERKAEEQNVHHKQFELHKAAYVENLNGPLLFDAMYAEDSEGQKLNHMPTVDEMVMSFKEKFSGFCQQIFEYGLQTHNEREKEVATFWECIEDAKEENKTIGMSKINDFMNYKKKLWQELAQISDQKVLEMKVSEYNTMVTDLWEALMGLEMQLVDQLEDAIKEFERQLADMVSAFLENVQSLTAQCRDLENQHHEKLLEVAIITLEKVVKGDLEEDIPDDLRELFVDKDTIINAVTSSHDTHLLKIDNREEDIVGRINNWMSTIMQEIHDNEEISRNRARVIEINNMVDHLREEIDNLELAGGY